jgi:hypothetical protein
MTSGVSIKQVHKAWYVNVVSAAAGREGPRSAIAA